MASRILLISANQYEVPYAVFPLGLAQVNAALREAGHTTHWVDCLADNAPVESIIHQFKPDFIGVSLRNIDDVAFKKRQTFYETLHALCTRIKGCCKTQIIVGGSGFSIFPEELLERSGAEFGIKGEGESGLLALITSLEKGASYTNIPGLVYSENGRVRSNPMSPDRLDRPMEQEDRPSRLVDFYVGRSLMLNAQTQRGCSFNCCYCTYPLIEGRRHRRRPPELVAEELLQISAHGARYVFIVDSVFNSSPSHVFETCEAIIKKQLTLKWGCFLRPQGLTADQMEIMARAGLSHIEFGSDSFSDRVLAAYQKNLCFEDIRRSAELAARAKVDQCHFLILGGPGETTNTLEETLANSRLLPGVVVLPVVGMRVYPGTSLHERAITEGVVSSFTDLLVPYHYIAPGLSAEVIGQRLREFTHSNANWIIGEPPESFQQLVSKLRNRGVLGPLWAYFAMLQSLPSGLSRERLWNQ